jgi:inorganic triphosphatase YgiF
MADPQKIELELKLTGAAEDVARLRASSLIRALGDGPETFERLVTTYYDTPRGDLAAAGLSLRLREEGGRRVQTMKRAGPGGSTVARREEERALLPGEVFPARPQDPFFAAALAPVAAALAPASRTVTDRWSTELICKGARIEAAFDIGRAEMFEAGAIAAAGPLAEAEFELLAGDPRRLFALARRAIKESSGRLRLGAASKAEQARRLLKPAVAPPESPIHLETDQSAADVFAAALAQAAHRLADCQNAVIAARAPEGAHQMRVALRRLRAVERLFRKALRSDETEGLAARARAFASALGPARDWDVFCDKTLPEVAARAGGGPGFEALAARAFALRAEAWNDAAAAIGGRKFQKFLLDLNAAAVVQRWRKGARRELDARARRFARRALDKRLARLNAIAASLAVGGEATQDAAEKRHTVRIELKKLRYAAQLFRPLFSGGGRKRYIAAMSRLQDEFGALNDASVAGRLASAAAEGQGKEALRAAGVLTGYCAREAETAALFIAQDFAQFVAAPPFWRKDVSADSASQPESRQA